MSTNTNTESLSHSSGEMWRGWLNGIGIVVALIGLFWYPIWLGAIGTVLGIIGISGAEANVHKTWGWISIAVGLIVLILGIGGWTFYS